MNAVGTILITLPDGQTVTLPTTNGEPAITVAAAFRASLPLGWTAPAPVDGNITITGASQSGYVSSTATYVVSGAAPVESGFRDGDAITPVNDTLTFSNSIAVGTIVVVLPDSSQITVFTTAGETANAVASAFKTALTGGWSAPSPVGGVVKLSGPSQSGFGMSYAFDVVPSPPVESGFKSGSGPAAPVSDSFTFHNAIADGKIVITLPDGITKITLNVTAGESAKTIATAFRAVLPGPWTAPTPVNGNLTISGPTLSGFIRSIAADVVSGSLPSERNFMNGYSGFQGVTDTLTFGPATSNGTFVVTLPDGLTKVPVVITSAPRTAVQVASTFQSSLPNGWNLVSQFGNAVTFSAPITTGIPSTATDSVSGALPTETGFVDGTPITQVQDDLAFSASTSNGTMIITLPDRITNVIVNTALGETADAVAAAFLAALPTGWVATAPVVGVVTIYGPAQSGYISSTASYGASGPLPLESGFVSGIPVTPVKDNLTFSHATANGIIIVTLPNGTQVTVPCTVGEPANAIATAFRAALPIGWTALAPVDGNVTIIGPVQSGFVNSTSNDVPSGAMPSESGFFDGNPGAELKDTLSFGPASAAGTMIVTLPDGTILPVAIDSAKTAVQVASTFSKDLPSRWNLSQVGNTVTFSAPGQTGHATTAIDVVSGIALAGQNDINGTTGNTTARSLPSWGGATSGFITTWADSRSSVDGPG